MTTLEDEILNLRAKNKELAQKAQSWKSTATQINEEKIILMKENNELRLKLYRLQSGGVAQAQKFVASLQSSSEEAIRHLVQASNAITQIMETAKTYMIDLQAIDSSSSRWSAVSSTPSTDKIHKVPPMSMGGRSIQPVVSLSRTMVNVNNSSPISRSQNLDRNATSRALPMHMLQDVYIPLTRIDINELQRNGMENELDTSNAEEGVSDQTLEENVEEGVDVSQNVTEENEFSTTNGLDVINEDMEDDLQAGDGNRSDNPLEGPSWLLDANNSKSKKSKNGVNLEPDSTTGLEVSVRHSIAYPEPEDNFQRIQMEITAMKNSPSHVYTPTVRRRKHPSTPPPAPSPLLPTPSPIILLPRDYSSRLKSRNEGRVLQVLVPKMRLDSDDENDSDKSVNKSGRGGGGATPPKRPLRFDAPSPNGATDAQVIVSETTNEDSNRASNHRLSTSHVSNCRRSRSDSRIEYHDGRDSDSSSEQNIEGRSRRPRKAVTYKEKPLNRKLRR